MANQSLLSCLARFSEVRNGTLEAVELVEDVGRLTVHDGLDGNDLTRMVKGDAVFDLTRGQAGVGTEAAILLLPTSSETCFHSPGSCITSLWWEFCSAEDVFDVGRPLVADHGRLWKGFKQSGVVLNHDLPVLVGDFGELGKPVNGSGNR